MPVATTERDTDALAPRELPPNARRSAPDAPPPGIAQAFAMGPQRAAPLGAPAAAAGTRLVSIDAYRGLVMVLMVSAGLGIGKVVQSLDAAPAWLHPGTMRVWHEAAYQTDHAPWAGCSLWDLIQPSFMFLVGTAMAFSLASRRAKRQSFGRMLGHAIFRSIALIALGIFLISSWSARTDWTWVNVLTQIGLGYAFLFLIAWLKPRWQFTIAIAILVAYWGAFALDHRPPTDLQLTGTHLPTEWHRLDGFASHWDEHVNLAARADRWFLNLFPQPKGEPFEFNKGGYATLNFVPSLATMIFGLLAGELLRGRISQRSKFGWLMLAAMIGLGAGYVLDRYGICPIIKRIWSPSWALFSAGWAFLLLGVFYLIIDIGRWKNWSLPLVVVGANSIAIYCISMTLKPWVRGNVARHLHPHAYEWPGRGIAWLGARLHLSHATAADQMWIGKVFAPMVETTFFLLVCWMVCWWMYRKKIFIKI